MSDDPAHGGRTLEAKKFRFPTLVPVTMMPVLDTEAWWEQTCTRHMIPRRRGEGAGEQDSSFDAQVNNYRSVPLGKRMMNSECFDRQATPQHKQLLLSELSIRKGFP